MDNNNNNNIEHLWQEQPQEQGNSVGQSNIHQMSFNNDNSEQVSATKKVIEKSNEVQDSPNEETEVIRIEIFSRIYVLTCAKREVDSIKRAAGTLKSKLTQLSLIAPSYNNEQLAVLAALDFCHDLEKNSLKLQEIDHILEVRTNEMKDQIADLISK